jgi:hypothetical protein
MKLSSCKQIPEFVFSENLPWIWNGFYLLLSMLSRHGSCAFRQTDTVRQTEGVRTNLCCPQTDTVRQTEGVRTNLCCILRATRILYLWALQKASMHLTGLPANFFIFYFLRSLSRTELSFALTYLYFCNARLIFFSYIFWVYWEELLQWRKFPIPECSEGKWVIYIS